MLQCFRLFASDQLHYHCAVAFYEIRISIHVNKKVVLEHVYVRLTNINMFWHVSNLGTFAGVLFSSSLLAPRRIPALRKVGRAQ